MREIKFRGYDTADGVRSTVTFTLADLLATSEDFDLVDPDSIKQLVGLDVDGNEIYEDDVLISAKTDKKYKARLLEQVVDSIGFEKKFEFDVPFKQLVRADKLSEHKPPLFSGMCVETRKFITGELLCRENGTRAFQGAVQNAKKNLARNCFDYFIVDEEGSHQVIFDTIKQVGKCNEK